jgi:DDE superfamily endonuclease
VASPRACRRTAKKRPSLLVQFGDFFPNEPARVHFAEYLTGLLVAEHKTVSGIAREFADAPDQSCLNRFLTESVWDVTRINAHRLDWLQQDPATRYRQDGVIAIDNTLIDHDGKLIEDVGYFWDHAEKRHLIAHDYLFANYVNPNGKHC